MPRGTKFNGNPEHVSDSKGYAMTYAPNHAKANPWGYVQTHILAAEEVLRKPLPDGCEVHHVDGNTANGCNANLVICQDHAYHLLLHRRQRAFDASGNPNYIKCFVCGSYDDPKNLRIRERSAHHAHCYRKYAMAYCNRKTEEWRKEKDGRQHRTESKQTDR